jgi:hypothetical protein
MSVGVGSAEDAARAFGAHGLERTVRRLQLATGVDAAVLTA